MPRPASGFLLPLQLLAALLLPACERPPAPGTAAVPVPEVEVMEVVPEQTALRTRLNGIVSAYASADIRPQVSGLILEQLFIGGETVSKGQQLYQIDPRSFQNRYDYAVAEYEEARSKLELARTKLRRYVDLSETRAVSQQGLEDVKLSFAEAEAQAKIKLANLNDAKLNLEYTQMLSPIDGIVGKSAVTSGALVIANQAQKLTSVVDISKVYVDLQQSALDFRHWQNLLKAGALKGGDRAFAVHLVSAGPDEKRSGILRFSEVEVDAGSGNLTLRALFDNSDHALLPGMNVTCELDLGQLPDALVLPERALLRDARGESYAFIVKDGKAERRNLTLRSLSDGRYLVSSGLSPGDQVITVGKGRLRGGMNVRVLPAGASGDAGKQAAGTES